MKKKALYVFMSLTLVAFVSCSNDDADTEKPVIENVEPHNGDTLVIGENIHFEADFSDNDKLASYRIEIHHNFDNHGHKSVVADSADSIKFSFDSTWTDIAGLRNAHAHHHTIAIPAKKGDKSIREGKYHFIIYCLDQAGNMSVLAREVTLSYTEPEHGHEH